MDGLDRVQFLVHMQNAYEVAGERVLKEGSLDATLCIETIGSCHDILLEPLIVTVSTLRLFCDQPVDTAIVFVNATARFRVGWGLPFMVNEHAIDPRSIEEQCYWRLHSCKGREKYRPSIEIA